MAEQESHENTLKKIELHKQGFVDFVEAEKIDDDFKEIIDLRQRNSELTELIENLLANEDSDCFCEINCEKGVQTDVIGTGVENSVELEKDASFSGYGTESGVRVKTEIF